MNWVSVALQITVIEAIAKLPVAHHWSSPMKAVGDFFSTQQRITDAVTDASTRMRAVLVTLLHDSEGHL